MDSNEGVEGRIDCDLDGGVAWLTLRNGRRRNAISLKMAERMVNLCDELDSNLDIGAVIMQGEDGYFSSGAELSVLSKVAENPAGAAEHEMLSTVYRAFTRFGELAAPTVATVAGGAVGAGVNLAFSADVVLIANGATLDSGFLRRGIHPGGGHVALSRRFMTTQQVMSFVGLGRPISSAEAVRHGLVLDSVEPEELTDRARDLVTLAAGDPVLARRIKASARLELGPPGIDLAAALEVERGAQLWSMGRRSPGGDPPITSRE